MKISFELKDNVIAIMSGKNQIGQIFVDTEREGKAVLQVCGFDDAYCLWGCGVFGENNGNKVRYGEVTSRIIESDITMKKDIQLLFRDYKVESKEKIYKHMKDATEFNANKCFRCYNLPCTCENKVRGTNPFNIKTLEELKMELQQ